MGCVGTRDDQVPEGQGDCGALVGYVDDGAYSYAHTDPGVLSAVLRGAFQTKNVTNCGKVHNFLDPPP